MSCSNECPICYEAIEVVTTGRVEMSCRHAFHFKCLATWFASQEKGTCPMCRKEALELEDFDTSSVASEEEDDEEDEEEDEELDDEGGGFIRVPRASVDALMIAQGGFDLSSVPEDNAPTFDVDEYTIICRVEFDYLLSLQGARALTEEQWAVIMAEFPVLPIAAAAAAAATEQGQEAVSAAPLEVKRVILNPEEDAELGPEVAELGPEL